MERLFDYAICLYYLGYLLRENLLSQDEYSYACNKLHQQFAEESQLPTT